MNDAVGEEGADADKEIVDKEETDEELVPEPDKADGIAGAADALGKVASRPDGPNVLVFCPASLIFCVFGGISTHIEKRLSRNQQLTHSALAGRVGCG